MSATAEQRAAVMAWRRSRREQLIAARQALPIEAHSSASRAVRERLSGVLDQLGPVVLAGYCPIRREIDPFPLLRARTAAGVRIALPVVRALREPLQFRLWQPGARMSIGVYDIPYPADGEVVQPDTLLVPMLGFDEACYRLGYGGGYYDRTLAALTPRPRAVGLAFDLGRLDSIRPLPHDVPMDCVVTETAVIGALRDAAQDAREM